MRFSPSPTETTDPADGARLGSGARKAPYIKPFMNEDASPPEYPPDVMDMMDKEQELIRWLAAEIMFLPPGIGLGR